MGTSGAVFAMVMVLWFSEMDIPVPAVNVFGTGLFSM